MRGLSGVGRLVAIAVSVTVAVFLAVLAVALIAGFADGGIGHDKAEEVRAELLNLIHAVGKGPAIRIILTDNADQAVGPFGDDQRIRHDVDRREVDDDDIEDLFIMLQQGVHLLRPKQLRGVGRDVAGREDVPVLHLVRLAQAAALAAQTGNQVREARGPLQVQLDGHGGQTHIGVDEQDALAGLGDRIGEVDRGGALALAADRAGHADDVTVLLGQREKQVGPQKLVGLGGREAQALADDALLDVPAPGSFLSGHQDTPPF